MRSKRSGESLVGVMIAVIIVIVLVVVFVGGGNAFFGDRSPTDERPDGQGNTIVGKSMLAGKDSVCQSNLKQVRMAMEINPGVEFLGELGVSDNMTKCAVGEEPYDYDAAANSVKCVHPGHEKY